MEITDNEKRVLLLAARESIKNSFDHTTPAQIDYLLYPLLKLHLGAFVTLKMNECLRGCIGYVFTKSTLFNTICKAARQAAFFDPRFVPVTSEELENIKIEISVLSAPQKINDYNEILIGKHGLILDEADIHAVLLPQVAEANNFLREQFLSALCEKGGLSSCAWQNQKLNLRVFTATIFSEDDYE